MRTPNQTSDIGFQWDFNFDSDMNHDSENRFWKKHPNSKVVLGHDIWTNTFKEKYLSFVMQNDMVSLVHRIKIYC